MGFGSLTSIDADRAACSPLYGDTSTPTTRRAKADTATDSQCRLLLPRLQGSHNVWRLFISVFPPLLTGTM